MYTDFHVIIIIILVFISQKSVSVLISWFTMISEFHLPELHVQKILLNIIILFTRLLCRFNQLRVCVDRKSEFYLELLQIPSNPSCITSFPFVVFC